MGSIVAFLKKLVCFRAFTKNEIASVFWIGVVLFILHLLRNWIFSLLNSSFLDKLLKTINIPSLEFDIFISLLLLIIFGFAILKGTKRYLISFHLLLLICYSFLYYIIIRFDPLIINGFRIVFLKSDNLNVNYSDLFFGSLFIGLIIYLILYQFKKKSTKKSLLRLAKGHAYYVDHPIENDNDDLFDYPVIADKIFVQIINLENLSGSFTIGINGQWGSGKSSLLRLVKNRLNLLNDKNKSDHILIDFSPLLINDGNTLTVEFLNQLNSSLKKVSSESQGEFRKYIYFLTGKINDLVSGLISIYAGDKSSKEQLEVLSKLIKKIDRKIIILIDDLDRVQKDEILQIFRLIRNIADLPNLIYVIAVDKSYLVENLDYSESGETYIEKFFNVEITIPLNDNSILRKEVLRHINSALPYLSLSINNIYGNFEAQNALNNSIFGQSFIAQFFDSCLKTKRDLNRFMNALLTIPAKHFEEVIPEKLLIIELLKLKHLHIFNALYNKRIVTINNQTNLYQLHSIELEAIIDNYYLPEKNVLTWVINTLFGIGPNITEPANPISIVNVDRYSLYFNYFSNTFVSFSQLDTLRP
jgi:hypothetical protein